MQKHLGLVLALVALSAMVACGGGKKVLISQSEIDAARQSGELAALYDKASNIINQSSGSAKKEAIGLRSNIAKLLVTDKTNQVNQVLTQHSEDPNSVPRKSLVELKGAIAGMQTWSATDYARLAPRIGKATATVNSSISALVSESKAQQSDLVASLNLSLIHI